MQVFCTAFFLSRLNSNHLPDNPFAFLNENLSNSGFTFFLKYKLFKAQGEVQVYDIDLFYDESKASAL